MNILFIENRYSTRLWEYAADALSAQGHSIYWIIQNHVFMPKKKSNQKLHILKFPSKHLQIENRIPKVLKEQLKSDRGCRYYGLGTTHHVHYFNEISDFFLHNQIDVAFGEATQVHELITINICKEKSIPYLRPTALRYPSNRVCFSLFDSMETFGGSNDNPSSLEVENLIKSIVSRVEKPDYMSLPSKKTKYKVMRLIESLRVTYGWLKEERYLTPSPFLKLKLNNSRKKRIKQWNAISTSFDAKKHFLKNKKWVLYLMQLQPESNIDVFGHPWSNQDIVIEEAAKSLKKINSYLVVKPNPKAKYEITPTLINLKDKYNNIIFLKTTEKIEDVFSSAPAVLSITGTVIIECMLSFKKVAVLGSHSMTSYPNVKTIQHPKDVSIILDQSEDEQFSHKANIDFITSLYKSSYNALLWDPINHPEKENENTVKNIKIAFSSVIKKIEENKN